MSSPHRIPRLPAPIRRLASPAWLVLSPAVRPGITEPLQPERPGYVAHFHGACGGFL